MVPGGWRQRPSAQLLDGIGRGASVARLGAGLVYPPPLVVATPGSTLLALAWEYPVCVTDVIINPFGLLFVSAGGADRRWARVGRLGRPSSLVVSACYSPLVGRDRRYHGRGTELIVTPLGWRRWPLPVLARHNLGGSYPVVGFGR